MHVISKRPLREFWEKHPQAENPLKAWHKVASRAAWKNFQDVKSVYVAADRAGQYTIFDIGGNKWRVITVIHYDTQMVFIGWVFTHSEYDDWNKARKTGKRK